MVANNPDPHPLQICWYSACYAHVTREKNLEALNVLPLSYSIYRVVYPLGKSRNPALFSLQKLVFGGVWVPKVGDHVTRDYYKPTTS